MFSDSLLDKKLVTKKDGKRYEDEKSTNRKTLSSTGSAQERITPFDIIDKAIKIKGGGNKRDAKSNVYEISYQGSSANRAYQVVSSLLNTMIDREHRKLN